MTTVDKKGVVSAFGAYDKIENVSEMMKTEAMIKLTAEVENMFRKLPRRLAGNRASY